jgi:hypothetical protein
MNIEQIWGRMQRCARSLKQAHSISARNSAAEARGHMEPEGNYPILINQLAIEQAIHEERREKFREGQRRRGFRLVSDLAPEEVQQLREDSPILLETQPDPVSQEEMQKASAQESEARELIEKVKSADPNSEEFWEGQNALFFGRDREGNQLPESERMHERRIRKKKSV